MAEVKNESPKSPKDILKDIYEGVQKTFDKAAGERKKADPAKDLIALKDEEKKGPFEAPKATWSMNFDLGQYYVKDASKKPTINKNAVYFLTGRVDQTTYDKNAKRQDIVVSTEKDAMGKDVPLLKWYQDTQVNAKYFLKYMDRVEFSGFKSMDNATSKAKMVSIITKMSEMKDYTDEAWNKMIKDNKFTDDEIFGVDGAYNLILAFGRAAGNVDLETDAKAVIGKDKDGKNIEEPVYYKIRLELAKKKGRSDEDRFGKIVELKVKEEEKKEPKKEPKKDDEEAKKKAEEAAKKKAEEAKKKAEEEKKKEDPKKKTEEEAKKKAEEEAKKKAEEETKKAAEGKEKEKAQLKPMLEALKNAGFELTWTPTNFGQDVYTKYGEKRLNIALNKDGSYTYGLLSRPESRDHVDGGIKGKGAITEIKAKVDSEPVDREKVMTFDLSTVFIETKKGDINETIRVKSVQPNVKDPGTYNLVIETDNYEMGGKIYKPFEVKVLVEYQGGNIYRGDLDSGSPVGANKDAKKFVEIAIKIGSQSLLKDGKLEAK